MEPEAELTVRWRESLEKVMQSTVVLQVSIFYPVDLDDPGAAEGTGFVVDGSRGLILTNRHLVGAGPCTVRCIFHKKEEVAVDCILYIDPVHDFAILQYDPQKIIHKPAGLELRPDLARVGLPVRVVGNDAGETLSILSAVISRLDRNPSEYDMEYNDFNICYYQANATATGGSSGSPVVNEDGYVVALQSAGRSDRASTDFFLPLEQPLRALRCLQGGNPVTRGDIQCQFRLNAFQQCRRLGLSLECENQMREQFPNVNDLLVATRVLPEGPSDTKIKEGDILISINGKPIVQHNQLDDIMNSNVGNTVRVHLQRDGQSITEEIEVKDIHEISLDKFCLIGRNVFHRPSYQQAMCFAIPVRGVYMCDVATSFNRGSSRLGRLLLEMKHRPIRNIDDLIDASSSVKVGEEVSMTVRSPNDPDDTQICELELIERWRSTIKLFTRDKESGAWDMEDLRHSFPPREIQQQTGIFPKLWEGLNPEIAIYARSVVWVHCNIPEKIEGFPDMCPQGYGLVINAAQGLVLVTRAIVPHLFNEIKVFIAESVDVTGEVVFLHPFHNYAVVKYDPSRVDAPVESAKWSSRRLQPGAKVHFLGFDNERPFQYRVTTVTDIKPVKAWANKRDPRYRPINVDEICVEDGSDSPHDLSVLLASDGGVQAVSLPYLDSDNEGRDMYLSSCTLLPVITTIRQGSKPQLRSLSVELAPMSLQNAKVRGLSQKWIEILVRDCSSHPQTFEVVREQGGTKDQQSALLMGDVVLELGGKTFSSMSDLDLVWFQHALSAVIIRSGKEQTLQLHTTQVDDMETTRLMHVCGANIHKPHLAIYQQVRSPRSAVYVASTIGGSPAEAHNLEPAYFITSINDTATLDLDSFLAAMGKIGDETYFKVKAYDLEDNLHILTVKKNDRHFPLTEVRLKEAELTPCDMDARLTPRRERYPMACLRSSKGIGKLLFR